MDQPSPIKSPCVLICAIEPKSGHCHGCGRTRNEIAGWTGYTETERAGLMAELPLRVAKLERRPRRITKRNRMRGETTRRDTHDLTSTES